MILCRFAPFKTRTKGMDIESGLPVKQSGAGNVSPIDEGFREQIEIFSILADSRHILVQCNYPIYAKQPIITKVSEFVFTGMAVFHR